jgi:hypothetical protein
MSTTIKRAHRTHALLQPAGSGYPQKDGSAGGAGDAGDEAARLFGELCDLVPDPAERAGLIGVSTEQDTAWRDGKQMPVLRARRRAIAAALSRAAAGGAAAG